MYDILLASLSVVDVGRKGAKEAVLDNVDIDLS